ncbi:hypothetical protein C8245_02830 [Paracidovorax avenae]|uniref:PoNe immunity protein domain-containing protein n=1 Tax=Paracidovorax avenae TaxID=80867 RepID=UPI000D2058F4|nr:PoNe immunity protein domain-containing protein [Paracidovorax avenae]AVS64769.1 hypothetical protein C8245_02830 [Paracidovorax avenae]
MRDTQKTADYFADNISFSTKAMLKRMQDTEQFPNVDGRPGRAHSLLQYALQIVILRYSAGEEIQAIKESALHWIEARELQQRVLAAVPPTQKDVKAMYERVTLDTVYDALTMMAFGKALHFNASEMKRLINAIGHPGEDALIDEGARALGDAQRPVAEACKFPKVYDPLLEVWRCDPSERPAKLLAFSKVWKKKIKPIYWSDSLNGEDGAYFGYWCFDVALAAIALDIPDEALRDNPYYPKDLVDAARAK